MLLRNYGQVIIGSELSFSIASRRLYLLSRSDCVIEPTLIWSPLQPTARSASQLSLVSPLRALMVTRQPASFARRQDLRASVSVPIWFTFNNKVSAARDLMALSTRAGL